MKYIGVIGGASARSKALEAAREAGSLIATRKAAVVCGGLGGVMQAACEGAKKAGGLTIGILPGRSKENANKYVDIAVATGMNEARNAVIVNTADAFVAIDGEFGTLSEIAFALKQGKPVAGIGTHDVKGVIKANTAREAVEIIFKKLGEK